MKGVDGGLVEEEDGAAVRIEPVVAASVGGDRRLALFDASVGKRNFVCPERHAPHAGDLETRVAPRKAHIRH